MKILVRLPNWLGDMVMSLGFLHALKVAYPAASISVIAKKGLDPLLDYFPQLEHRFIFSKEAYPGLRGSWRFGRMIRRTEHFDLFFTLPDSFSSALVGFASGSAKRIGFRKELRGFLLTASYERKKGIHRVEEYLDLLRQFNPGDHIPPLIRLNTPAVAKSNAIVFNINSEAVSRRLPVKKSVSFIEALRKNFSEEIILVGGPADAAYVTAVLAEMPDKTGITDRSGKTSLPALIETIASAKMVLTTDSGPAHLANALGVYTVVLFGAGNENNTAPYNPENRHIVRLGDLPCEPCVKNTCMLYGIPQCLDLLDIGKVMQVMKQ